MGNIEGKIGSGPIKRDSLVEREKEISEAHKAEREVGPALKNAREVAQNMITALEKVDGLSGIIGDSLRTGGYSVDAKPWLDLESSAYIIIRLLEKFVQDQPVGNVENMGGKLGAAMLRVHKERKRAVLVLGHKASFEPFVDSNGNSVKLVKSKGAYAAFERQDVKGTGYIVAIGCGDIWPGPIAYNYGPGKRFSSAEQALDYCDEIDEKQIKTGDTFSFETTEEMEESIK